MSESSSSLAELAPRLIDAQPLVSLRHISKSFPGVQALLEVSLDVYAGEIVGLVGENGAGKSTLMKILSAVYPHSSFAGEIFVRGKQVSFAEPAEASKAGIAIIHQELLNFAHLSVADNFFVGRWLAAASLVQDELMRSQTRHWLKRVGAECEPEHIMGELSAGTQQLIEIAKALSRNSEFLILDEPTSSLTPQECVKFFALIKELRRQRKGLVYISHKLDEVFELCDRIVVLRDGKTVAEGASSQFTQQSLIGQMVGRALDRVFPPSPARVLGEEVLRLEQVCVQSPQLPYPVGPLSLSLRKGEILGFGGLLGSGRSELMRALMGDEETRSSGAIWLHGRRLSTASPRQGLQSGVGYVSEDRKRDSLLPFRSLVENLTVSRQALASFFSFVDTGGEAQHTSQALARLKTRTPSELAEIQNLSGGNQQKVFIARALEITPDILILDEPTRGIDVGAKYEIYEIIFELASSGKALLLVSSDLPELMALSDRVAVLARGRLQGVLERSELEQNRIMSLAFAGDPSHETP